MVDFSNKLLQVPSKSVHDCVRKWCKGRHFILRPFLSKKYIKDKVKVIKCPNMIFWFLWLFISKRGYKNKKKKNLTSVI